MKTNRIFACAGLLALAAGMPFTSNATSAPAHRMPPNPAAIRRALEARGVIPAGATDETATRIVTEYIQKRLANSKELRNVPAAQLLNKGEATGKPVNNHGRIMAPNNARFDNVLTLLVEFAGTDGGKSGPLHNEIKKPTRNDGSFWIPDFNQAHYQNMLFDRKPGGHTMATYYLEQSAGTYTVDGAVFGWVKLDHSESFYGANDPNGSGDDLNGPVWRVVADAAKKACNVPWKQFDTEDPYDLDGDGITAEPDGYVDHLQVIHAGTGEEVGGGAQGEDAIWSHSWDVNLGGPGGGTLGGSKTCDPSVNVLNYTIMPEDGTIGVFSHEFGHDLGLPDLYDTIYSGEPSTSYWTIMSSGSYLACSGEADGTCPSSMGVWERWQLGWIDPVVVRPFGVANNVLLKQTTAAGPAQKAIQVRLPDYKYTVFLMSPKAGTFWHSGQGDLLNNTLTKSLALPVNAQLSFDTNFNIEKDWDYGYVEVSTDGGATWHTVKGNLTTSTDPNGNNAEGNGLTGSTGGQWLPATYDMSAWGDRNVLLRFRYETDPYTNYNGWGIDNIAITGAAVDPADATNGWAAKGWSITNGTAEKTAFHYYMAEWRTPQGFDVSMNNWFGAGPRIQANPGMLLWYRNSRYTDNWVGVHPWAGRLLVVDAHKDLVLADTAVGAWLAARLPNPKPTIPPPFGTWVQIADATFGTTPTLAQPLTSWYGLPTASMLPSLPGAASFDDSQSYVDSRWLPWFYASPSLSPFIRYSISSVYTPHYGLKINVTGSSPNSGMINVDFSGFHQ